MVDEKENLTCSQCNKKALYRDKLEQLYCEECYWKDKNRPSQETYHNSNIYKECPHCTAGDLCSTTWCNSQCICGIYLPEGMSCPTCKANRKEQIKAVLNDCYAKLVPINQKQKENLTTEDWQTFKDIQRTTKALTNNKEWLKNDLSAQAAWIEADINYLQKCLQEIEALFPEELKIKNKSKSKKQKSLKNKPKIKQPLLHSIKRERERERERESKPTRN
ncbi:MAG: hypothetical protein MRECE_9c004 [Mycoplasmataceae bacterium CE_OT135]|nr:MAG: hypothetical protein MRECE_9c004 [Mycoplasmataceae bacterium CE_OT135]